jgi:hypothetical protein
VSDEAGSGATPRRTRLLRVAEHVRAQNWTAIGIDFVIVVIGVFVGIQVSNWNQLRTDRAEYEAALERLSEEIDANLAMLDDLDSTMARDLDKAGRALTLLQSCVDSDENLRIVEEGLDVIRGTEGLRPRRNALDEVTTNPRLLSQQTVRERKRLSELLFYYDALQSEADFANYFPLEMGMENNPILVVRPAEEFVGAYFGREWRVTRRNLGLNVPLRDACRDNQLLKSFFNWERRQASLPNISRIWREELLATKQLIESRR